MLPLKYVLFCSHTLLLTPYLPRLPLFAPFPVAPLLTFFSFSRLPLFTRLHPHPHSRRRDIHYKKKDLGTGPGPTTTAFGPHAPSPKRLPGKCSQSRRNQLLRGGVGEEGGGRGWKRGEDGADVGEGPGLRASGTGRAGPRIHGFGPQTRASSLGPEP